MGKDSVAGVGALPVLASESSYAGLTALMLVSPPLPSEAILPVAGFYVGQHELAFPLAMVAATVGALGHALLIYGLARWGGRTLLMRVCAFLHIHQRKLDRADARFARHGARIVLFGRMMSVVRWLVGIPAGAARMPLRRYVPLTAAGCMVWNSALLGAGWALGSNHAQAGRVVSFASLGLITAAIAAVLLVKMRQRHLRAAATRP